MPPKRTILEMESHVESRLAELCPGTGLRPSYDQDRDVVSIRMPPDEGGTEVGLVGEGLFRGQMESAGIDARIRAACETAAEVRATTRWIATVRADGEAKGDAVPYQGLDESGVCIWRATTHGSGRDTPVSYIASTPDEALAGALRCWERSEAGRSASD